MPHNDEQRNDTKDTRPETPGAERPTDSGNIEHEAADGTVLDTTTEGGGTRIPDPKAEGETEAKSRSLDWTFASAWNAGIASVPQREIVQRDYLWASELYKAPIDVWLSMRAEKPTNPPNERSLMKFEAAHLVEWVVGMILRRAGILKGEEVRVEHQYDGLLKVTGRMDKLAGGVPNYEFARAELEAIGLPEGFLLASERIIKHLQTTYPEGLGEKPIEIKSVSSFAMDSMEKNKVAIKKHRVQLYHYLKGTGNTHGLLVYICRDDNRMIEFPVLLDSYVEAEYRDRIELLTKFHRETEPPPKEKLLIWDTEFNKFSKNLDIEYSNYLTKLYGFEVPRDYGEVWGKKASDWNRILKRVKAGAKMTDKNLVIIEDMKKEGYDPEELAKLLVDETEEEIVGG